MDRNPDIVIVGLEEIIKRDLEKHKTLLARSKIEMDSYKTAVSHEIKKKKHYKSLIGGEKYNDDSLRESMDMIAINIRHLSDKVKLSQEAIDHHTLIVDTLSKQLEDQYEGLKRLKKFREDNNASAN
jgi:hypothetical protein